ncbi:MAG: dihydropteroate synthase [Coriobacteriia bacterium]
MSVWKCGRFEFSLDRPLVMGIINVTPDSFSDGGVYNEPAAAVQHGLRLYQEGAHILDIGGESTRPGARAVTPSEEISRVRPVLARLVQSQVPVSVDTRNAECARACLDAGASVINDIAGFRHESMIEIAAGGEAGLVVMHMLGEPGTMQNNPVYGDVVAEVRDWLLDRALALEDAGVARDRIAIDPGIGFGKNLAHNLALMRALPEFASYGYPVLVGVSRKRFIGQITGVEAPRERTGGSVAAAAWAVEHGAHIVRVHDVAETAQAVAVVSELARGDGSS